MAQQLVRALASVVRNVPINRMKGRLAEKSLALWGEENLDFEFYSRALRLQWSARGYPDLLTRHMLFEGMYQQDVIVAFQSVVRPGDTVFDVGGHHGLMAIVAARLTGPDGIVISFEPNPQARRYFSENCALNQVDNVRIESVALSNEEGSTKFFVQKGPVSWNSSLFQDFASQKGRDDVETIDVQLSTLNRYVRDHGIVPKVIKIDAEGAECLILKGAMETIEEHRPAVIMEFNPDSAAAAGTTIAELQAWFEKERYRLRVLTKSLLGYYSFDHWESFDENKHATAELCNVVCLPEELKSASAKNPKVQSV